MKLRLSWPPSGPRRQLLAVVAIAPTAAFVHDSTANHLVRVVCWVAILLAIPLQIATMIRWNAEYAAEKRKTVAGDDANRNG